MPNNELEDIEVMALIRKHNEKCPACKKLFDKLLSHVGKELDAENDQSLRSQQLPPQSNT